MRDGRAYLVGLSQLHLIADDEERRGVWRQGMASLAAVAMDREPAPLEGLHPDAVLASVRVALNAGLLKDLDWLSPAAACVAVFELANALPPGLEKRELGRRTLQRLHDGDATTFVALATALALSSKRPLHGATVRARVALALETPPGAGTGADALALALVSRRDLERDWLQSPSTGSLPSRRLAARLLERAAREAARRLVDGDESGLGVFTRAGVREAWLRLLGDRESLVWRHVAIARGLLAHAQASFGREIERDLAPSLEPTRWRRAATSLAATIAADPGALARCRSLLAHEILERDPGVAKALMQGLAGVLAVEPEMSESFAAELIVPGGIEAIEALVELRREHDSADACAAAARAASAWLADALHRDDRADDGRTALLQTLADELAAGPAGAEGPLAARLRQARQSVLAGDPGGALDAARDAVVIAIDGLETLNQLREDDPADRRHEYRLLRELDMGLLETGTLAQVLLLEQPSMLTPKPWRGTIESGPPPDLYALLELLEEWLLAREGKVETGQVAHVTLRVGRLRALVRLMDAESRAGDDANATRRARRLRTAHTLLERAAAEKSLLRRAVWAALTRAWDGLLRDEFVELSDMLIGLSARTAPGEDFLVLREASMIPDVERVFHAYAEALRAAQHALAAPGEAARVRAALASLLRLARSLPPATSARVEALRSGILRSARALELCAEARSLEELHPEAMDRLETAVQQLALLVAGAELRLGRREGKDTPASGAAVRLVQFAIERAVRGAPGGAADEIDAAVLTLRDELLPAVADAAAAALGRLARLPVRAAAGGRDEPRAPQAEPALPTWLPPGRTLGGFYLLRPIGTGAGGSVFVASRAEERHEEGAEHFALKVPDYDGGAARNLSEDQFEQLFREEARALLSLPRHTNIAHFVTFDAGARPKPILVMELVQGPTLEHLLQGGALDMPGALAVIDGIAAGLAVMHEHRVAHLDLKPANVILRIDGERDRERERERERERAPRPRGERIGGLSGAHAALRPTALVPVLVDFGLAGRKLRPGCGSPHYGAPEVWSQKLADATPQPFGADVYAFCCLAYELCTGQVLVNGESMIAVVAAHLSGQAGRDALARLAQVKGCAPLAELLAAGLHREAPQRPPMAKLRAGLASMAPALREKAWPLVG